MPGSPLPPRDSPQAGVRDIHVALRDEIARLGEQARGHSIVMSPERLSDDPKQTFRLSAGDRWVQIELEWFERAKFDPALGGPPYRGVGAIGTSWGARWKIILWDSLKKAFQWGSYEGNAVRPITREFLKSLVESLPTP